jgi:hypothetical protein
VTGNTSATNTHGQRAPESNWTALQRSSTNFKFVSRPTGCALFPKNILRQLFAERQEAFNGIQREEKAKTYWRRKGEVRCRFGQAPEDSGITISRREDR